MRGKRGFELSFAWIFAIIAGAVILFLAIYTAVQFIDVAKIKQSAEAAKSITILIDPVETGIASAVGEVISFDRQTRVYTNCYAPTAASGEAFGKQSIALSEESGLGQKWAEQGPEIFVRNKFIFADAVEQGKKLFVFSKQFEMGFRVSDLIFMSTEGESYCFAAPPNVIDDELASLSAFTNLQTANAVAECPENSKIVCFNYRSSECDAVVVGDENSGYVEKSGQKMYYTGSLVYGAVFSTPEIYECNAVRLGAKISELAEIYRQKIDVVALKDCDSAIEPHLTAISSASAGIKQSSDLAAVYNIAREMSRLEEDAICKIYS